MRPLIEHKKKAQGYCTYIQCQKGDSPVEAVIEGKFQPLSYVTQTNWLQSTFNFLIDDLASMPIQRDYRLSDRSKLVLSSTTYLYFSPPIIP